MGSSYATLLQRLTERLGLDQEYETILTEALTHRSAVNEMNLEPQASNERLEFLGDAVLELIVSEHLFRLYPNHLEGELTRLRAAIVCEPSLAARARAMGLGEAMRLGRGEALRGGAERPALLADAFEACVGAVFIQGGAVAARQFVERHLLADWDIQADEAFAHEAKTALQELVQAQEYGLISYDLVEEQGPAHDKTFTVQVRVGGHTLGTATGKSKKQAEQLAAREALVSLSRKGPPTSGTKPKLPWH
ncbi:MAG: ribonuclease III [Bacillota bacterium]